MSAAVKPFERTMFFARPEGVSWWKRKVIHGIERAMMVSIVGNDGDPNWSGKVVTDHGPETISSSDARSVTDGAWVPDEWVWCSTHSTWIPPEPAKSRAGKSRSSKSG